MKIAAICFLLMTGIIMINTPMALSDEEGVVMISDISGEIASIDQENSEVVVKPVEGDDVTVSIDGSTSIEKNYETVGLDGLTAGDSVVVEYVVAEDGKKTATYISIETE